MSVIDVCECVKNEIQGLKSNMMTIYIQDLNENNISGRVLATCELEGLKQVRSMSIVQCLLIMGLMKVLSMTFGDWVLFSHWILTKREEER
jgi:hypothetical protein